MRFTLPFILICGACTNTEAAKAPERSAAQVWSTDCRDQSLAAKLRSDATYSDGGGGHGRWRMENGAIQLTVIKPKKIDFMSLYPELISMDQDGRLPFVGPEAVEAESEGLKKQFHRCK